MRPVILHDKARIAAFLQRNPALHDYQIGDLDDFFWPYTIWFGLEEGAELRELALLYAGTGAPVLLALSDDAALMGELLRGCNHLLPRRIYSHLSAGVLDALRDDYADEPHGDYLKMRLADPSRLDTVDTYNAEPLGPQHRTELEALYTAAYPGNWFDPRMLETGQYVGVRRAGQLAAVAGVHVYSPTYGVASLGNITTRPELRGQGLATAATATLCRSLLRQVANIGLNVNATNEAAIATYRKLGFVKAAEYSEHMLTLRAGESSASESAGR
jgi:ribosomal protein S18 acetylase RimI-like enzyme